MAEFADVPIPNEEPTDESVTEEVTQEDTSTSPASTESEAAGTNPAWQPLLDKLPAQLRPMIEPNLKEWDDNYRALNEKYNTLKGLEEFSSFDPSEVRAALQVAQRIADNPREVADIMAQSLGLTFAEAKEVVKELEKEQEKELEFSEEDDPRLVQIYEENKALKARQEEFFQQQLEKEQFQEQQKLEQRFDQEINSELGKLYKHDPGIQKDDLRMQDLMQRAYIFASNGADNPIVDAYNAQAAFISSNLQRVAPKNTPLFMPTNGNAPPAVSSADLSTEEGKRARAMELVAALKSKG